MTKTILMAASALSLLAAPAFAQDSASISLNGTVAKACNIMGGNDTIDLAPYMALNSAGFLDLAPNAFTTVGNLDAFGDVWCNTKSTVTFAGDLLSADGSTSTANNFAGPGFTHKIAVRLTNLNVGGVVVADINTGQDAFSGSGTSAQHFAGDIQGDVQIYNDATRRPIAGGPLDPLIALGPFGHQADDRL